MATSTALIVAMAVVSALIVIGLMVFAVRRVWRAADEVKRQIDEERIDLEGRRDRLRRGLTGPPSSFGRGWAA